MTACKCIYKFCQTKEYLFKIFFSVLFKNLKDISMILHDFSCFIQDFECFIICIRKKYSCFITFKKIYSRFFKIFQDYLCFVKDLE